MLLSGLFFVGCGESGTANMTISASQSQVELFVGDSAEVSFTLANYAKGVDTSISFTLTDATVSPTQSQHVRLEKLSSSEGTTTIRLTGISGGHTKLTATSNEGGKQTSVDISVREYSQDVKPNPKSLMFVSKTSPFKPSGKMFIFDDAATERELFFHIADIPEDISEANAFVSAELVEEEGKLNLKMTNSVGDFFMINDVSDGQRIKFFTLYQKGEESIIIECEFSVIYGFTGSAIDVKMDGETPEKIILVANDNSQTSSRREAKLKVAVPHNSFITFDHLIGSDQLVSVEKKLTDESSEEYDVYDFSIVSATSIASTTQIVFRLYYVVGDTDYSSSADPSVSQSVTLPIEIRVAPRSLVINSVAESAQENNYNFYQNYVGDYGWQEFDVDVYATDSSFDYVKMTFESDIIVRYKKQYHTNFVNIDDLSEPVYIRGAKGALPTDSGKFTFEVISDYLMQNEKITYTCNYKIVLGASDIEFSDEGYNYDPNQMYSGVFISTSHGAQVFDGLRVNQAFNNATATFEDGDENAVRLSMLGCQPSDDGKFKVMISVVPSRVGIATYKITLDNGLSKNVTFRVERTLDDANINLTGLGNESVQSAEKVESDDPEIADQINIVIQNESTPNGAIYSKHATMQIGSLSGSEIFSKVEFVSSNKGILDITSSNLSTFMLSTLTYGETNVDWIVTGPTIKDFRKISHSFKVRAHVTSFVPISTFNIYQDAEQTLSANNISLYVGNAVSDPNLQRVSLSTSVGPSLAYGFYDPFDDSMKNTLFSEDENRPLKYIYWTIDQASAFVYNSSNERWENTARLVFGNTYRIGISASDYFGVLDFGVSNNENITFSINRNRGSQFTFTMFASIRQYGLSKHFPVTIKGQSYDQVDNIYTNLSEGDNIQFSPLVTEHEIGVFLNPPSATDTSIVVQFINENADSKDPILIKNSGIVHNPVSSQSNSAHIIKVSLNPEVLGQVTNTLSGRLQIIPNAWFVDGKILSGYENSVVNIKVSFENGSIENPYLLQTPKDVKAIGESENGMKAHYKILSTIDMSGYSNIFPLGKHLNNGKGISFSGSIVGENGAEIIGLDINDGVSGAFGFFSEINGTASTSGQISYAFIKDLTFKGRFNIKSTQQQSKVGMVAGVLGKYAFLDGVKVEIDASSLEMVSGTIGGMVGTSNGEITNMHVIFNQTMNVRANVPQESNLYIGGIVGQTSASIIGQTIDDSQKNYGLSAYSAYTLIEVTDTNFNEYNQLINQANIGGAIGNVVSGNIEISNLIVGGKIKGTNAAGLVYDGGGDNVTLGNYKSRINVYGKKAALIGYDFNFNMIEDGSYIIQATDDGKSTSLDASMLVVEEGEYTLTGVLEDDLDKLVYGASGKSVKIGDKQVVQINSYVDRTMIDLKQSYINVFTIEEYFGDVAIINTDDLVVKNVYEFTKLSSSFSVKANEAEHFYEMKISGEDGSLQTADKKMIWMFYFEAAGYYQDGEITNNNLSKAQQELDKYLNTISPNSPLYPFDIDGTDVTITSQSEHVKISTNGVISVRGTGVAKIEISSSLNKKQNEIIYLKVINYFNAASYLLEDETQKESGIFSLGNLILGENSTFKVYSNSSVDVMMSPSYSMTKINIGDAEITIDRNGNAHINNHIIALKRTQALKASVTGEMKYGSYSQFLDGITFSKNYLPSGNDNKNHIDIVTLDCYIYCNYEGKEYRYEIATLENVKINYYEGATEINNTRSNYVVNSSSAITDQFIIETDDIKDELIWNITDENGNIIVSQDKEDGLFNFDLTGSNGKYPARLSVDKNSQAFINRFDNNIYKTYNLNVTATSRKDEILKTIPIMLVQQTVDKVSLINYPNLNEFKETDTIIPAQYGYMAVTLTPIDGDFDYVEIANNQINSALGGSIGSFTIGYLEQKYDEEGNPTEIKFTPFSGAQVTKNGIKISRQALESNKNFNGQFYVRYIFSNIDIADGAPIGVDVTVSQRGEKLQETYDFKLVKRQDVYVKFLVDEDREYVARGLKYELDVRAYGCNEVQITSTDPQIASIVEENGKYFVVITSDEARGKKFSIQLSAKKVDEFGVEQTVTASTGDVTVIDYYINYDAADSKNQDIVAGMVNGTITTAIGDKFDLAVTFENMIEYDETSIPIRSLIDGFLNEITNKGKWELRTDLNINSPSGFPIKPLPLGENDGDYTASELKVDNNIKITYLNTNGLSISTLTAHSPENRHYYLVFESYIEIDENTGRYKVITDEASQGAGQEVITQINIYSYLRGSEQSPNPVRNYQEFLDMEAGGYYILLDDIIVPSEGFTPLNTAIAYFDGNGHSFIFSEPNYNLGNLTQAGLFGTIDSSTVIKNITIEVGSKGVSKTIFASSSISPISFGLLAGVNNGVVTNARVLSSSDTTTELAFSTEPWDGDYHFGGLIGQNNGYLTHSRVTIKMLGNVNMGGLASSNSGSIASSSFVGGKIINTSSRPTFMAGGLVVNNGASAKIITSYVSGIVDANKPYSDGEVSNIDSTVQAGGFAHTNEGEIIDCYASIPIYTSSSSAGFVFKNEKIITRCFSTSKIVTDNSAANFYFAGESSGRFEDCYYITGNKINTTLASLTHKGVEKLIVNEDKDGVIEKNEFNDKQVLADKFKNYSISQTPAYNSVWFLSTGSSGDKFDGAVFAGGRLELVAPNMLATSQKVMTGTNVDGDGVVTYYYATAPGTPADGSPQNPYVIYSPETMENYLVTPNNISSGTFRIVCDIDYSGKPSDYSKLYKQDLQGNLEGNGATISAITLSAPDKLVSAGLFGSISGKSGANASITNLELIPQDVSFVNAAVVGSLVGTARNANIFNIKVYGASSGLDDGNIDELITVTGKNIVGGVVGLTDANFEIKNVSSMIGAFAANVPFEDSEIDYETQSIDTLSFAGGVVGYLGGRGNFDIAEVPLGPVNVVGAKAGLLFGGIAKNATAQNLELTINSTMLVKAYRYGGLMAGEVKGTLKNARVKDYGVSGELFSLSPLIPTAVGGIAGLLRDGGTIDNLQMTQGFAVEEPSEAQIKPDTIDAVGGIVGQVKGNNNQISRVIVDADFTSRNIFGGVVGEVLANANLSISQAAVKENTFTVTGQNGAPTIGGVVGKIGSNARVNISDSYCWANIKIDTYTYATTINANYGSIIGSIGEDVYANLNRIYTTSLYDITVEDKTAEASLGGRVSAVFTPEEPPKFLGFGIGGLSEKPSEGEDLIVKYPVNYTITSSKTNVKDVYNSSLASLWTELNGNDVPTSSNVLLDSGWTTLYARKNETDIKVTHNEYGVNVYDYFGKVEGLSLSMEELQSPQASINKLYKGKPKWITEDSDNGKVWSWQSTEFAHLAFESQFLTK